MQSNSQSIWWPRLAAFGLAALAAARAGYWGLKWPGTAAPSTASTPSMADATPADPQALARALGGGGGNGGAMSTAPVPLLPSAASRLALVGVVANDKSGGAALISVDGKPARPYRVGSQVDEGMGLVLQSVAPRRAVLASSVDGPTSLTLEMPLLRK